MNRANLFLMLGLVAGTGLGFLASGAVGGFGSGATGSSPKTPDNAAHDMSSHDHSKVIEVPTDRVPTVTAHVVTEDMCVYNIHLTLTNFRIAPEAVNGPHKDGEGHLHIYVDGQKMARVYGEWFHLTAPPGSKDMRITLNSNDHATLAFDGRPVETRVALTDC